MRVLIDTHALLWFVEDSPRLSQAALTAMSDSDNSLVLSPASYWELAIKVSLGKYTLSKPLGEYFREAIRVYELAILPIDLAHAAIVAGLPHHHGDPFDRLLIAQAMAEELPIVSRDKALDAYQITRIW